MGHTYILPEGLKYETDEADTYLTGSKNFGIKEMEIFFYYHY
jgi:hypothetical protein